MKSHDKEKRYIIFQPPDNPEVQKAVGGWLKEANGSLTLDEIERKFDENFHFFYPQIYTEDELMDGSSIGSWRKFAFRIENNVVYEK